jgi:hypothetical protein
MAAASGCDFRVEERKGEGEDDGDNQSEILLPKKLFEEVGTQQCPSIVLSDTVVPTDGPAWLRFETSTNERGEQYSVYPVATNQGRRILKTWSRPLGASLTRTHTIASVQQWCRVEDGSVQQVCARLTRTMDNYELAELNVLAWNVYWSDERSTSLQWKNATGDDDAYAKEIDELHQMFAEHSTDLLAERELQQLPYMLKHTDEFGWEANESNRGRMQKQAWIATCGDHIVEWNLLVHCKHSIACRDQEEMSVNTKPSSAVVFLSETLSTFAPCKTSKRLPHESPKRKAHKSGWFVVANTTTDVKPLLSMDGLEMVRKRLHMPAAAAADGWRLHSLHTIQGARSQRFFWDETDTCEHPLYHVERWKSRSTLSPPPPPPVQVMSCVHDRLPRTVQPLCAAGHDNRVRSLCIVWYALHPELTAEHEWDQELLFSIRECSIDDHMTTRLQESKICVDDRLAIGAAGPVFIAHTTSADVNKPSNTALAIRNVLMDCEYDAPFPVCDTLMDEFAHEVMVAIRSKPKDVRSCWTWRFPGTTPIIMELRLRPRTGIVRLTLLIANEDGRATPLVRCTWSEPRATVETKQWCAQRGEWHAHPTRPTLEGQTRAEMLRYADDEEAWLAAFAQGDDTDARIHWFDTLLSYEKLMHPRAKIEYKNSHKSVSTPEYTTKQLSYVLFEALVLATPLSIVPPTSEARDRLVYRAEQDKIIRRGLCKSTTTTTTTPSSLTHVQSPLLQATERDTGGEDLLRLVDHDACLVRGTCAARACKLAGPFPSFLSTKGASRAQTCVLRTNSPCRCVACARTRTPFNPPHKLTSQGKLSAARAAQIPKKSNKTCSRRAREY